jgi:hypothetical protein
MAQSALATTDFLNSQKGFMSSELWAGKARCLWQKGKGMEVNPPNILLEKDGVLINRVAIKNPSDGSRCKVRLIEGKLVMRMLDGGTGSGPSIRVEAVPPGHCASESNGEPRLILLLPPFENGKAQASFPVVITCSLTMAVSRRLKSIIGDVVEEYNDRRLNRGKGRACIWVTAQVFGSIGPIIWQIVRYDLRTGLNGWKVWGLPFSNA